MIAEKTTGIKNFLERNSNESFNKTFVVLLRERGCLDGNLLAFRQLFMKAVIY